MFFRRSAFFLLFILTAGEFGCRKPAPGPPPRYAVVRFENLTGDPSLDWMGRAATDVLASSLDGALDGPVLNASALGRFSTALGLRPAGAPGTSAERTEAFVAGASRLISGYVERAGKSSPIRFVAVDEDMASGKTLETVSASASSETGVLSALGALAREISPRAKPYLTANAAALQQFFIGLEAPMESSAPYVEKAVGLDPNFGPAWLGLVRLGRLRGDRNAAENTIAQARTHKLDPLTLAELDYEDALANAAPGDEAPKLAAMRKISALTPGDTALLRTIAEAEETAGQFAAAASDWKKLADALPRDGNVWNSLGYARSWAGDFSGALAALQQYQRLRPNDANPWDSTGDLYYVNRKFAEAASSYLQADAKDTTFQRYGELYKAAWAKFRAGDKSGADSLFQRFRTAREKTPDDLMPLLSADWLYRTGRMADGIAALRQTTKETQSVSLRAEGYTQLAVWDLLEGNRTRAAEDVSASGNPVNAPEVIMRFAAGPSASAQEWKDRAERVMAPLRRTALGYALLLDGKREAAVPVWEEIVRTTPATDFFTRAVYARLRNQDVRPLVPEPNNLNQFAALLDKL